MRPPCCAAATPPLAAGSRSMPRGLLSKGEPLGASGLGQVYELTQQLRDGQGAARSEGPAWR